ncbi:MAG: hypothetical protein SFY81_09785 [Verrucomicrobiota bacterium]|nr:hypothetical protein [Verrucomicrobiota bacterium]
MVIATRLFTWLVFSLIVATTAVAKDKELTAFDLIKEGNRYIGEHAKDKVVQIRSEKSINSLTPNIWFVVYYDSTATFKAVEVKFGAGKMLDVKRPIRALEPVTGGSKPLDITKLKIDSDKAIKIASTDSMLEKITVKSVQAKLERHEEVAAWKIKLWAAKLAKPSEQVEIGTIILSAEDGAVLKNELKIDRVD